MAADKPPMLATGAGAAAKTLHGGEPERRGDPGTATYIPANSGSSEHLGIGSFPNLCTVTTLKMNQIDVLGVFNSMQSV